MKKNTIIVLVFVVTLAGWYYGSSEPIPEVNKKETPLQKISPADALANKMLKAIHKEAWDNIRFIQWSFQGKRHFVWDKRKHLIQVSWADFRVVIDPNTSRGIAFQEGVQKVEKEGDELVKKAIDAFNNDSFWLNAPAKVYDDGTERSIVSHKGKDALMVKYTVGGTTPGDSYLWILDDTGLPIAWKMWVSNIPVEGMELTWEEWADFDGTMLSQFHKGESFDLRISNIKVASQLIGLGIEEDIFAALSSLK